MVGETLLKAAAEAIELAFAAVPYPGDDNIADYQDYNPSDGFSCAQVLRGKHWREVQPESLLRCGYPFLTPAALQFFLPAYLLGILRHPEKIDVAGDFIVYGLKPPFGGSIRAILGLLSGPQKKAIRLSLEAIAADAADVHGIAGDAQAALKAYWDKC